LVIGPRSLPAGWITSAVAIAMILGILFVYYVLYLITPFDLDWHLATSLDRLILQVWPAVVFLFFYHARTPREVLASASGSEKRRAQVVGGADGQHGRAY
jgi:hypothetical protein